MFLSMLRSMFQALPYRWDKIAEARDTGVTDEATATPIGLADMTLDISNVHEIRAYYNAIFQHTDTVTDIERERNSFGVESAVIVVGYLLEEVYSHSVVETLDTLQEERREKGIRQHTMLQALEVFTDIVDQRRLKKCMSRINSLIGKMEGVDEEASFSIPLYTRPINVLALPKRKVLITLFRKRFLRDMVLLSPLPAAAGGVVVSLSRSLTRCPTLPASTFQPPTLWSYMSPSDIDACMDAEREGGVGAHLQYDPHAHIPSSSDLGRVCDLVGSLAEVYALDATSPDILSKVCKMTDRYVRFLEASVVAKGSRSLTAKHMKGLAGFMDQSTAGSPMLSPAMVLRKGGSRRFLGKKDDTVCRVCVRSASNLLAMDENGLSDPYCTVRLGVGIQSRRADTPTIRFSLNPRWNFMVQFTYCADSGDDNEFGQTRKRKRGDMSFKVHDKDWGEKDDFLGGASLVFPAVPHRSSSEFDRILDSVLAAPAESYFVRSWDRKLEVMQKWRVLVKGVSKQELPEPHKIWPQDSAIALCIDVDTPLYHKSEPEAGSLSYSVVLFMKDTQSLVDSCLIKRTEDTAWDSDQELS
ncbi:hypothetical protein KIPB_007243, partial [Kipferlia bialata]|eukprot:g7243.t1